MNEIQVISLPFKETLIAKNVEIEKNGALSLHQRLAFYMETSTRT